MNEYNENKLTRYIREKMNAISRVSFNEFKAQLEIWIVLIILIS
jgi:hypothetical protein